MIPPAPASSAALQERARCLGDGASRRASISGKRSPVRRVEDLALAPAFDSNEELASKSSVALIDIIDKGVWL